MPLGLGKDTMDGSVAAGRSDESLEDAQEGRPTLREFKPSKAVKEIRKRWDGLDTVMKKKQAELKVNYLRYLGHMHAQVHPRNENRVYLPPKGDRRQPPALNKLRRAVHRYTTQITADQPIIEALPAAHTDKDRDAAEAATHALRGEWHRMSLNRELQRAAHLAGVFRSSFWFFEWDDTEGGRAKAEKFFVDDETNERYVAFVDSDGNEVEDPEDAATIWRGNAKVEVMTPMNVRWRGGRYAHEANELMVAKVVKLRDLYNAMPKTRKFKLDKLLGGVPREGEKWLQDIRGESFESGFEFDEGDADDLGDLHGDSLTEDDSLLDEPVFLLHYFLRPNRTYPNGFHAIITGQKLVHRGSLRYGVMPIAHFKLIDEVSEPLGVALVDMLKDPQELLDFVRGQILRHLQMMRRRWFLPQQSNVSHRDLTNPDKSVIEYDGKVEPPKAETQPEINSSIFEFLGQSDRDFDDILGLGQLSQGKHVPGVSSGRHAEALKQADETLMQMTREQFKTALEHAGLVILEMVKKEWTRERRVRYMGDGRQYIDKAFKRTDFRETSSVRLKNSTLLMLTKAQKLETIFAFAEMGALQPEELRRLAPLADTAGISLAEDEHVQNARRQNEKFLNGPPDEAERAWKKFSATMDRLEDELQRVADAGLGIEESVLVAIEQEQKEAEAEFDAVVSKFLPEQSAAETMPEVAMLHVEEHARALAKQKAQRMPKWWREKFEEHFMQDMQAMQPPAEGGGEGAPPGGGLGPGEAEALANPGELPPPGLGAGMGGG